MNENLDPTNSSFNPEELDLEKKLRPLSFDDFTGQEQVLDNLKVFVEAANQRSWVQIKMPFDRKGIFIFYGNELVM